MENLAPLVKNKAPEDTTIVVAMSGGVDSSCVAAYLKAQGYNVVGITLQLYDYSPTDSEGKKLGTCCSLDDVYDARKVCAEIGIPHYVLDYQKEFKEKVINDFVETYKAGKTPIPCIRCNELIKFDALLKQAKVLGADGLATGHYVIKDYLKDGKAILKRGNDQTKDQTYFLFSMTQDQLEYSYFPIGHLTKDKTRQLAKELGLHIHSKKDSQDICFVPGGDYRKVVIEHAGEEDVLKQGNFVDSSGNVLGTHTGIINFTVGQRKGLGIALGYPAYVVKIKADANEVVLGPKEELEVFKFTVKDVNWLGEGNFDGKEVGVKVRSTHKGAIATLHDLGEGKAEVELLGAETFVAPGQACAFYDEDRLLGGGWIE